MRITVAIGVNFANRTGRPPAEGSLATAHSETIRQHWRMPPLHELPPAQLTTLNRARLIVLRAYLIVAAGLVLLRNVQLAIVSARSENPRGARATNSQSMSIANRIGFTFDHARRYSALGLFRLANYILRKGFDLYRRRHISRVDLRVVLSIARLLERSALVVMFGLKTDRDQRDPDGRNRR